nr:unnamed protein product [Digitaria exilis]
MEVDPSPSPPSSRPPPPPGYFDPESSGRREEYRRYRKRLSSSNVSPLLGSSLSKSSEARLLYDGDSIPRRPNAGLLLEDIKQEAEDYSNFEGLDGSRMFSSAKRRGSLDGGSASDAAYSSGRQAVRQALKSVKLEDDMYVPHEGETSFTMFASLLDSVIQGLMPIQDVILQFEKACRSASESIRSAASGKLRVVEDKFMQQKAQLLLDEAASWSLLWYLYGKGNDELPGHLFVSPTTSHQEACRFVAADLTAQLCLRIVLWLEGLASEALDLEKKVRGSHVGSYLPSSGVWHRTQMYLKRKNNDSTIVKHVDFDAPTREGAQLLPDDKKQDELLLEDIWTLLRAGRLDEASELCRSAGQKLHSSDLVHETVSRACREQHRQIEMNLMSGNIAHLIDLLWSWLSPAEEDQNVARPLDDPEMIRFGAHVVLVLRYIFSDEMEDELEEKLVTVGDLIVNILHTMYKLFLSAVEYLPFSSGDPSKACFEEIIERVLSKSRQTKPSKYEEDFSDVAHQHHLQSLQKAMIIQWLCFTPPPSIPDFQMITGKLLIRALMHSNTLFREFSLISMRRVPELPAGPHKLLAILAEPLKQKENLFSLEDQEVSDNLQEFEDWHEYYSLDATYRNWLKVEMQNAAVSPEMLSAEESDQAVAAAKETLELAFLLLKKDERPWLDAVESSPFESSEPIFLELHAAAMLCLPSGECMLPDATSCTALTSALYSTASEEDVLHRQLKVDIQVSPRDPCCIEVALRCLAAEGDGYGLHEANDGGLLAAIMAAGFKGELSRFQPGVSMAISRLDAWYSDGNGSVESTAAYIIRGLCRRCCLPETILRSMQACISLSAAGVSLDDCYKLVELVGSSESGMMHLFSQQQLQEFLIFERECLISKMELEEEQQLASDG